MTQILTTSRSQTDLKDHLKPRDSDLVLGLFSHPCRPREQSLPKQMIQSFEGWTKGSFWEVEMIGSVKCQEGAMGSAMGQRLLHSSSLVKRV